MSGIVRGSLWATGSMVVFAIIPICVRELSDAMSAVEIVFFRNLIGFAIMSVYFWRRGPQAFRTGNLKLYSLRASIQFVGMVLWFYALGQMALDKAVAIHFTMPLFIVLMAALFLGERANAHRWAATAVGFLGVLVILRPGMVEVGLPAIGVLVSAALYGGTTVFMKILVRSDSPALVNFYSNLMMALLALPFALYVWQWPAWDDAPWLLVLGFTGAAAPFCIAAALKAMDASVVAPFDYLRLPFTAILAYLVFAERPDVWTWAGAAIIIASTYTITRSEAALERSGGGGRES